MNQGNKRIGGYHFNGLYGLYTNAIATRQVVKFQLSCIDLDKSVCFLLLK